MGRLNFPSTGRNLEQNQPRSERQTEERGGGREKKRNEEAANSTLTLGQRSAGSQAARAAGSSDSSEGGGRTVCLMTAACPTPRDKPGVGGYSAEMIQTFLQETKKYDRCHLGRGYIKNRAESDLTEQEVF